MQISRIKNKRQVFCLFPLSFMRGGFSLIELMVVVAIIAILAVIAVPSYMRHKLRSHFAKARVILNEAEFFVEGYYEDFGDYPNSTIVCDNIGGNGDMLCDEFGGMRIPSGVKVEVRPQNCNGTSSYLIVVTYRALESNSGGSGKLWKYGKECENPSKIHCDVKTLNYCNESPP